jgi:hypothetical protein
MYRTSAFPCGSNRIGLGMVATATANHHADQPIEFSCLYSSTFCGFNRGSIQT